MAMIKCPECGHEVSDKAPTCPNCGCPIKKETHNHNSMEYKVTKQVHSELKVRHMVGIVCGFLLIPVGILAFVAAAQPYAAENPPLKTLGIVMGIMCIVLGLICAIYSIAKYREL